MAIYLKESNSIPVNRSVVFFGSYKNLTKECLRCGAYEKDNRDNASCVYVSCPMALREFKRRRQVRDSALEQRELPHQMSPGKILDID